MPKIKIAPSILSADFSNLQEEVDKVRSADYLHVDVMDGHFVDNITIGPLVIKDIRTELFIDVHLMIDNPEKFLEQFVEAGAQNITVHYEGCNDVSMVIDKIRSLGIKASVSIKPETTLDKIKHILDKVDMVLLMTVNPGFGGQKFIENVLGKISELRKLKPELDIEVDGGINSETVKMAVDAGANVIVAGSFIFGSDSPQERISQLRGSEFIGK